MTVAPAGTRRRTAPPPRPGSRPGRVRGYSSAKDDYPRRLRKMKGQVSGLQKVIEADTCRPDVVLQVASATRAMREVAVGMLNHHISNCVMAAVRTPGGGTRRSKVAATFGRVVLR
jgi:CsoR family transcriptional regulator, copper-sensing transcriptional repressor